MGTSGASGEDAGCMGGFGGLGCAVEHPRPSICTSLRAVQLWGTTSCLVFQKGFVSRKDLKIHRRTGPYRDTIHIREAKVADCGSLGWLSGFC